MEIALRLVMYAALTFVIETPVMLIGLKKELPLLGWKNVVIASFLVNFITNLAANLIALFLTDFVGIGPVTYKLVVAILEAVILITEFHMYQAFLDGFVKRGKMIIVVTIANIVSFILGIFITRI